jgi:FkbM family methyltransferase
MPHAPLFRHPIGRAERFTRKLVVATKRRLGRVPFTVRAQGARFVVDPVDFIDELIALDGIWDGPQLDDLAAVALARPIDLFLDVGANSGFYSVMFAIKNLSREIIAFEPDPGNYARLLANLSLNGLGGRVRTLPLALGDAAGEVTLYEGATWNRGESTIAEPDQTPKEITHQVRQARFDDEFAIAGKSVIVKMDVEGYEFHSLAGMERTLRQNECYVQVELYSERFEELKDWFEGRGFRYLRTLHIDHYFTNMAGIG